MLKCNIARRFQRLLWWLHWWFAELYHILAIIIPIFLIQCFVCTYVSPYVTPIEIVLCATNFVMKWSGSNAYCLLLLLCLSFSPRPYRSALLRISQECCAHVLCRRPVRSAAEYRRTCWVDRRPDGVQWEVQPGANVLQQCINTCSDQQGVSLIILGVWAGDALTGRWGSLRCNNFEYAWYMDKTWGSGILQVFHLLLRCMPRHLQT